MADEKLIKEICDRAREAADAVNDEYEEMLSDLRFGLGEDQWPQTIKQDRTADGRPCLTINKLPSFSDQIMGDIRQNKPSIKVKPVDDKADPDTAEVMTGLIRNIESQSNADIAYMTAAESMVQCGKGSFRIVTEYADDDAFEQDIRIKRIKNPFTVHWDPGANEWNKADARYCFVSVKIPKDEFERMYPNASTQEFQADKDANIFWGADKTIRVAEYFRRVPVKKTLYLLKNPITGEQIVSDRQVEGFEVSNTREVESHKVEWYKTNGREILEGPTEWPGRYIPIVDVYGKEINIEDRTHYRGVWRNAKDPQRLYNYSRSHNAEATALAPKIPVFATPKMVGNNEAQWNTMHKKNWPYVLFNPDPEFPQGPFRPPPMTPNPGALTEIQIADQELHDTTGMQQASLGKTSNEKSGRAIAERRLEGDRGNIAYADNLGRAIRHCGTILLDLIPRIYDSERVVRVLGEDGVEDRVTINGPQIDPATGQPKMDEKTGRPIIYDLTMGKYDVTVSLGPSYQTQREEAADGMVQLFGGLPDQAKMLIADLIVENLDWPGATELAERLKTLLPPGLADPDGPPPPPAPPDPLQMLQMEKIKAEVEKSLIGVQKEKAEIEKILIENRIKRNEAAEAEFMPDDIPTRKAEAEIAKLNADAIRYTQPAPGNRY